MPRLSEMIKTTVLTLGESKAKVTVWDKLSHQKADEIRAASAAEGSEATIGTIAALAIIKEWDVLDDSDQAAPITAETLGSMPDDDVNQIANYAIALILEKTKKADKK